MFRFIALTMLVTATALASQIAYDGFDYSPGPLNLQNGGVGFSTPWFADPGVDVLPPGLSQPLALPSTGLEIGGDFNASRMLSNPLIQPIYWASFEISRTLGGNDQVFFGLDTILTSTPFLSFGRQLDNYFVDVGGMPPIKCCIGSGPGVTDLLVARFVQTGPFTNMDLWINTNNFASPPNISTTFPTMAFAWVNMQVQPGLFADEVRLGTTAGDVAAAAIPEPGTFALIGFGLALFVMVRRVTRTTLRS